MKTLDEIAGIPGLQIFQTGEDGGTGLLFEIDPSRPNRRAGVVWSNGGGWDHVSVSFPSRCPTWNEMCRVKQLFFRPDEVVIEYHPAESEYVNMHPFCLHLWRPQEDMIPTPPSWMVGAKKGETVQQAINRGLEALQP